MWEWISALDRLRKEGRAGVLVTVSRTRGSVPREIGAKMIVLANGSAMGTIGGGHIELLAIRDALDCLEQRKNNVFTYPLSAPAGQCCGGVMELLMEVVNTNPRLYLYGAGHVGQALCRVLDGTGFTIHLVDARETWIHDPRLPESCIRHAISWSEFNATALWGAETVYAVVMTPDHSEDFEILRDLLPRPLRYLGVIGSIAKWTHFEQMLANLGFEPEAVSRVRCPVGVGDTGKAPAEIAISIAAEILLEHNGHHGYSTHSIGGGEIESPRLSQGASDSCSADLAGDSVPGLS
jgi:xanthine dehydrogenase accessory factor